ncbi:DUF1903-domain-containing protein [Mycena kentingensis (nom. inval.)]|nr:DUF1903-domain-containing protein [Mycena kentingensis (nom. inval.)]
MPEPSSRPQPKPEPQPCQPEACALGTCLNKHTYQPEKCDERLRDLYICCQKMYQNVPEGNQVESTACPMESVVKRWLKDHPEEKPSAGG